MTSTPAESRRGPAMASSPGRARLSDIPPGSVRRVVDFDASVAHWREQLQAYGLAPGREVEVIQQQPVTVVRVERIDLAFEARIAIGIMVD